MADPELTVVIPCYNEEGAIGPVVSSWRDELDRLGIAFEIRVYDDGSRDRSREILQGLAEADRRVVPVAQANAGHGPTVLRGYREARTPWVFQVDGDGELQPSDFEPLWRERDRFDLLLGFRQGRLATGGRRALTAGSRGVVRLLFGPGVTDVNTPFRLIRRSWLDAMLPLLPSDSVIPNVVLAGLAVRSGARIAEYPARHENRRTGVTSVRSFRLWKLAAKGTLQAVRAALRPVPRWTIPAAS